MEHSEITRRFASNLRLAMEELGYSQKKLAKKAGCYQSFVSDVVNGKRIVRIHTADRFAKAVGVETWQIFLPKQQFLKVVRKENESE